MAGTMDFLPTFARLAGAKIPADREIDGKDLWPLLSGATEKSPHDHFYYFGGGKMNFRGIRDERWKLIVRVAGETVQGAELYDLGRDVSEKFDRMKDHPDIAKRLEIEAKRFYGEISRQVRPLGILEEK